MSFFHRVQDELVWTRHILETPHVLFSAELVKATAPPMKGKASSPHPADTWCFYKDTDFTKLKPGTFRDEVLITLTSAGKTSEQGV